MNSIFDILRAFTKSRKRWYHAINAVIAIYAIAQKNKDQSKNKDQIKTKKKTKQRNYFLIITSSNYRHKKQQRRSVVCLYGKVPTFLKHRNIIGRFEAKKALLFPRVILGVPHTKNKHYISPTGAAYQDLRGASPLNRINKRNGVKQK